MEDTDGGAEPTCHPFTLTALGGWPASTQATGVTSMYWSGASMEGSSMPTANSRCRPTRGGCSPFQESSNKPYCPHTSPEDSQ